jgi:predicted PurR-regulated permease PerM
MAGGKQRRAAIVTEPAASTVDPGGMPDTVVVVEPQGVRTRQIWLTLVVIALAFWMALEFLTPIAWAAVIAIAEWPLYRRVVDRLQGRRVLVALGFALVTALVIIVPLSLAAVSLAQESQTAMEWIQHVQQTGLPMPAWLPSLPLVGGRASGYWQQHVGNPQAANALLGSLSAGSVLAWTKSIGGEVARESALFLITLLALITLLSRGDTLADEARDIARHMFGKFGGEFLERMIDAIRATVNGTVLVSVAEGGIIGVGYAIAGVPQPLLFATFTIMLALIPFGAWAAFGLATLILLGTDHILAGALLFGFSAIVMTIGDNVIQPTVIGSAVELPFLLAMIGAFGGLAELGLVGLFVGPVIMAALMLVLRQWKQARTPVDSGIRASD